MLSDGKAARAGADRGSPATIHDAQLHERGLADSARHVTQLAREPHIQLRVYIYHMNDQSRVVCCRQTKCYTTTTLQHMCKQGLCDSTHVCLHNRPVLTYCNLKAVH